MISNLMSNFLIAVVRGYQMCLHPIICFGFIDPAGHRLNLEAVRAGTPVHANVFFHLVPFLHSNNPRSFSI